MLALLPLAFMTIHPAAAQTLYENGPINGETNAWTINFGFVLGNSFTVPGDSGTVNGLTIGVWLTPGDVLQSAEVSITDQPVFGGTTYFDQTVNFTQSGCFLNNYSYDVCTETATFNGPTLNGGTYWVNLQNAVSTSGDPVYWDENSGVGCHSEGCPSEGNNGFGTNPSEAFTILGTPGGTGSTPEPGSLALFAGGLVASVGFVRRRLR
jgi:PEP-CTERM motif